MKLVLFPHDDRTPEVYIDFRSVTVTPDQVLIEDAGGGLQAYVRRDVAELTMDLTREHTGEDPFIHLQLHDPEGVLPEREGDGEGDAP